MSAGGVFKLVANDGKADRLIMATKLLNQRIQDIMCARQAAGKADPTPTLVDLERTHIIFVNAHFKPFAAIGYEYNKVRPQSGTTTLGSSVTFSIPQFGDFWHDIVVRTQLSSFTWADFTTIAQGTSYFPANAAPLFYSLVDSLGNNLVATGGVATATVRNFAQYCEFPALRLFSKVSFSVNGNPLDEYTVLASIMLEKFTVPDWKRTGFNRLVGQEVPLVGYGPLQLAPTADTDATNVAPLLIQLPTGLYQNSAGNAGATAASLPLDNSSPPTSGPASQDISRQQILMVNGPQTPKPTQQSLVLWNKLRFWFCDDVRLAVPSVSIPHGQRFITIDLEVATNLVFEVPNLYLRTVRDVAAAATNNQRVVTFSPIVVSSPAGTATAGLTVQAIDMYINNIFMNPEIHDIYMKRIGFMLIRVFREQVSATNQTGGDEKQLSQLKWPVEYMFVGVRPNYNTSVSNSSQWHDWHRLTRQVRVEKQQMTYVEINTAGAASGLSAAPGNLPIPYAAGATTLPAATSYIYQGAQVQPTTTYWLPVQTVSTLKVQSHGITIYDSFDALFFGAYETYHYGGTALVTPSDEGALFVNFSLFPRMYQPSGHLNISRARETFISFTSSYVSPATPAQLIVVAIAINFLLVVDGSAVLRYST